MFCKNCGKEISDDAKFCEYCSKEVESNKPESTEIESNNVESSSDNSRFSLKKIISFCIILILIFLSYRWIFGTDSGTNVTEYKNESGAVTSLSLEDFSKEFEKNYKKVEKSLIFEDVEFDLNDSWEKESSDVDETGAEYDKYLATINDIRITAKVYDNKVSVILIDFNVSDDKEIEFATILSIASIMTCGDLDEDYANKIFEFSGVVYKNGLMFYESDYGYYIIRAASKSYVQSWNAKGISVYNW